MTNEQMKLVEDHIQLVHFIINKYLKFARGNEDIYQQGCLCLIKAAKSYDANKGSFSTIAGEYIRFGILAYLRSQRAQKRSTLDNSVSIDAIEFSENIFKDDDFTDSFVNDLDLSETLNKLDKEQKLAIELYYFEGYSQPEIAVILHTNQPRVHRLLDRGLKAMRISLSA